jgi:cytochrome c oxidase subunit 1
MQKKPLPEVHLPEPSYWPVILAIGLVLIAAGIIFSLIISLIGVIILLTAIVGWTLENRSRSILLKEVEHD